MYHNYYSYLLKRYKWSLMLMLHGATKHIALHDGVLYGDVVGESIVGVAFRLGHVLVAQPHHKHPKCGLVGFGLIMITP